MKLEDVVFTFKSSAKRDAAGDVVKDEKGEVVKEPAAPPMTLKLELFDSVEDLTAIVSSGDDKQIKLLVDAMNTVKLDQAKVIIDEDRETVRSNGIPVEKLTWATISQIDPKTRKGSGIKDEQWEAFGKDYIAVMTHHGKTLEQATMGSKLFLNKLVKVKLNKKVLTGLEKNIDIWVSQSADAKEHQDVYEYLRMKLNEYLTADEEQLVAAI